VTTRACLILAAGNGERMKPLPTACAKPFVPACGRPLLEHVILTAHEAGIRRFVVVVGERGWRSRRQLRFGPGRRAAIEWVKNEESDKENGVSALKARDKFHEPFLLLMADHLFQSKTAAGLLRQSVDAGHVILAVDRKVDRIFDLEDATKVMVHGKLVSEIGKTLPIFNAVDTGMFLCDPALFDALRASQSCGNCSLSDGMRYLSRRGRLHAWDIGAGLWLDVDTPQALIRGEEMLRRGLFAVGSPGFAAALERRGVGA